VGQQAARIEGSGELASLGAAVPATLRAGIVGVESVRTDTPWAGRSDDPSPRPVPDPSVLEQ
jgi:hypothetical protein